MRKPDAADQLKEQILQLEERRSAEMKELKEQLYVAYESLKPTNIIRKTLHDIVASHDVQTDFIEAMLLVVSRFISKKIADITTSPPPNMLKQLLGVTLQMAFSSLAAKYSDHMKALISSMLNLLLHKHDNGKEETGDLDE
ncbi:hypothetical protein [uncultured Acetobacteroides sp.]|uniref:hypothetical protein n=1 Tax=uncultured Acetobacteroides sp. TaxID=1760811 RepID=UPI0029F48A67|nr:hypothetical protein [uncultured Acetobacteroides sp.]